MVLDDRRRRSEHAGHRLDEWRKRAHSPCHQHSVELSRLQFGLGEQLVAALVDETGQLVEEQLELPALDMQRLVGLTSTHVHRAGCAVGAAQLAFHRLAGLPHQLPNLRFGGAYGRLGELRVDIVTTMLCAAERRAQLQPLAVTMSNAQPQPASADVDRRDVAS